MKFLKWLKAIFTDEYYDNKAAEKRKELIGTLFPALKPFEAANRNEWELEARQILARYTPDMGYSTCHCCHLPWWVVEGHTINFAPSQGCFAVCEMCWRNLSPTKVVPYYLALLEKHYPGEEEKKTYLLERMGMVPVHE